MIAAVNGACAGIGLMQALHCDVRFAARGAKFTTAYARRGLPAEYGSSWLLPRLDRPRARARPAPVGAGSFEADEAQRLGLVSRVCEPETVLAEAQAYAGELAAGCSPRSMAAIRRQVYGDLSRTFGESMVHTLALMQDFAGNPDFAEGVASFVEKRPARIRRPRSRLPRPWRPRVLRRAVSVDPRHSRGGGSASASGSGPSSTSTCRRGGGASARSPIGTRPTGSSSRGGRRWPPTASSAWPGRGSTAGRG